jgi:hypothetical protein
MRLRLRRLERGIQKNSAVALSALDQHEADVLEDPDRMRKSSYIRYSPTLAKFHAYCHVLDLIPVIELVVRGTGEPYWPIGGPTEGPQSMMTTAALQRTDTQAERHIILEWLRAVENVPSEPHVRSLRYALEAYFQKHPFE